ncbi:DMT family transporter [Pollutimonas harenae]|uniref:Guanidinium exporter n=1 Tax=Pollutimonas harenae TaxID=657015 RepID=A0A853GYN5_9BURK|nr:SMR family transporter [Pollutimonas harenae]NYT85222.1 QacE family quaternary ammonium compound efflux SMR transporter [Pollutimonas harenae]TEA72407.1 QacE family quaternary ammonium compound efflux SMR transporter [Pollutimonas harenae]
MTTRKQTSLSGRHAWGMLLLAGAFEIGYALSVGSSRAFTVPSWSIAAVVFFLLTLYFLSAALRTIDVGIAYAVWAGIGAVGAAAFGSILLDQALTGIQVFWLAVIIAGVVWLKLADSTKLQAEKSIISS